MYVYSGKPCPHCFGGMLWEEGERKCDFSAGKAVIGALIAGPLGVAAGALGKTKKIYRCKNCGYTIEK